MVALVRKIQRRLDSRDQIKQLAVDLSYPLRECPLELIERRAGLQRRHRVDEIRHRFGLDQIETAVQKRAERELTWLRQARAAGHGILQDLPEHHRTPVRADFDDILAGIRM